MHSYIYHPLLYTLHKKEKHTTMDTFELDTEVIAKELRILQEMIPDFATPVLEAIEHNNLNMRNWDYCVMGTVVKNFPDEYTEYHHNDPEYLSSKVFQTYRDRYGRYPEYSDGWNETNCDRSYMEVVALTHENLVVTHLKEVLPAFVKEKV